MMMLFPKFFLKILITGSIGLTFVGIVVLTVLVIKDFRSKEVW